MSGRQDLGTLFNARTQALGYTSDHRGAAARGVETNGSVPAATPPGSTSQPPSNRNALEEAEGASQLRWILRWTFLAVGAVILSAFAGFAGASLQAPYYGARSEIALYAGDGSELPEQHLATQILVVRSQAVLGPVSQNFKVSADDLGEDLSVDFPEGGTLMRIEYIHQDRVAALQRLDSIVNRYLAELEQLERRQRVSHEILVPPFILENPVRPRPAQAAAVGGASGLALVIIAFVLLSARAPKDHQV